jgi:hypothetical protein
MSRKIHTTQLDAGESFFFARELEYIKSKSYDIEFPDMKAFKHIPISTEAGDGAQSITYAQFEEVGLARIIELNLLACLMDTRSKRSERL